MKVYYLRMLLILLVLTTKNFSGSCQNGTTKNVLFIGNSYTYYNNLPQMIANAAASVGDNLVFDNDTPGGAYLVDQFFDGYGTGIQKIMTGAWDYVVLQDQSLTYTTYNNFYVNAARRIDSINKIYNPCAKSMYYITWGRKNDSFYSSYYEMDSIIQSNYMKAADTLRIEATAVGAIWRYLRFNHPTIELFDADESHPSVAGSYAAACGFYSTLFRKDPTQITFNSSLTSADANIIRNAAKIIVYDSLMKWNVGRYDSLLSQSCLSAGVNAVSASNQIKITPNPTTDILKIRILKFDTVTGTPLEIYSSTGQLIEEIEILFNLDLDVSRYPPGIYYIKSENTSNEILKFVKINN